MKKVGTLGIVLLVACATAPETHMLSAEPVAIVYRNVEEMERLTDDQDKSRRVKNLLSSGSASQRQLEKTQNTVQVEQLAGVFGIGAEQKASDMLGQMALLDPATRMVEPLEFAARGGRPMDWSADHGRLLYVANASHRTQLFEWDRGSGEIRQLTIGRRSVLSGCYGPEGAFAFSQLDPQSVDPATGTGTGGVRIYVRRPGDAQPRRVTEGPADIWPRWTPDGRWLLWEAFADGSGVVRTLDLTDPEAEPRTLGKGSHPALSPDGNWVVYSAKTRWGPKLFKMHPDGSGKRAFGGSPYWELEPAVSPDGQYVIYVGMLDGDVATAQLMARPIDGGDDVAVVLPQGGGGGLPVW